MNNIEKIIVKGAGEMVKKIEKVKSIPFPHPKTISINDIQQYAMENFNADFTNIGNNIIYIISADGLPFNYDYITNKFAQLKSDYKGKGKNYHVCHINDKKRWENRPEKYALYVGSAKSNAKGRFKLHFGFNESRETYAMYLRDWWPQKYKLNINYFPFGEAIDNDSLQIIEDLLWEGYEPLFGKKGGKNL